MGSDEAACTSCPHACRLQDGERGHCQARVAQGGAVLPQPYGAISALALDPIEKKPLRRYLPGSKVFSIGFYGCNLRCPFCQNHTISQTPPPEDAPVYTPQQVVEQALALREAGSVGIAYTYSEPGVCHEFVAETGALARAQGLRNVMITNGYLQPGPWDALLDMLHACNIDLKCFTEAGYRSLGGSLAPVLRNIEAAAGRIHVELTTLVVPGLSDTQEDMRAQARWIAGLSPQIPLHISRYFPRHRARMPETERAVLQRLADTARDYLEYVYLGNC